MLNELPNRSHDRSEQLLEDYQRLIGSWLRQLFKGNPSIDLDSLESQILLELIAKVQAIEQAGTTFDDETVLKLCRTIARNKGINAVKHSKRRKRSGLTPECKNHDEAIAPNLALDLEDEVNCFYKSLSISDQEIVKLRQHLSCNREISDVLGVSIRTVQLRLHVLEHRLRNQLDWHQRGTRDEGKWFCREAIPN